MSLYKRGRFWHYDFRIRGRRYRGSTGHVSKTLARQSESDEMEKARLGQTTLEEMFKVTTVAEIEQKTDNERLIA